MYSRKHNATTIKMFFVKKKKKVFCWEKSTKNMTSKYKAVLKFNDYYRNTNENNAVSLFVNQSGTDGKELR